MFTVADHGNAIGVQRDGVVAGGGGDDRAPVGAAAGGVDERDRRAVERAGLRLPNIIII